jgi:PAS domain S-box-containing protein
MFQNDLDRFSQDLRALQIHDHPCTIYDDNEELKRQFVPYLQAGLLLGERCVYFIDENTPEFVTKAMRENGFNLDPYLFSKAFLVINTKDAHLSDGYFSEEKMMKYWADSLAKAEQDGFTGLRAAVEMTWALSGSPGCDVLAPYEARLNNFTSTNKVSVICQYRRNKFNSEQLKNVVHAHPSLIANDRVLANPSAVPAEAYQESCPSLDLQVALDNLILIKHLSEANQRLEQQLRSEQMFGLLVGSVKDYAIFMLDVDGNVMTWNEGAKNIKGYADKEIIGKHFSIFYPRAAVEIGHPKHELEIAIREGRYEEEGWRIRKDGSQFWANVVITALFDQHKKHIGFAKVTRDLTERRAAEDSLRAAVDKLQGVNEELQRLAFVVSHELQEPLSAITRYSNLLTVRYKERLGTDADEFLDRILHGAKLTGRLVDDLWTYARLTRWDLERAPLNTGAIMRSALADLKGDLEAKSAVVMHPPDNDFPTLSVNAEQLQYVFREVLGNAIKHHRNGDGSHPTVQIEVKAEPEKKVWTFTFRDNGPGIDPFFQHQIFAMYKRLENRVDATGTGMGLAICKKIIDQYKGRISYHPASGGGTVFLISLPESEAAHVTLSA